MTLANARMMADVVAGVERTGAVRAGRGYVYRAEETGGRYRLTRADLAALGEMLRDPSARLDPNSDAYSQWCAAYGEPLRR